MIEQGIDTIGYENPVGRNLKIAADSVAEFVGVGVGIAAQAVTVDGSQSCDRLR
ncbi:MAG: hypothetical protein HC795_18270 [Coleofasciculaceae cyanobacterium RL_1_1]|nr:hypothetical protein [Coleofasciculaceae cyanobacterium RL_1_1]